MAVNSMSGIIVDVLLFFIVAGNAVIGYRRGLVDVIFHICSSIIAIVIVSIIYIPVTNYIFTNTNLSHFIDNYIQTKIGTVLDENNIPVVNPLEENPEMNAVLEVFIGNQSAGILREATNDAIGQLSGLVTKRVLSMIVYFALFAIIRLLLYILKNYIDLVANLPIIRVFNGSGGMIYGIVKGLLIIYLLFAIISVTVPMMNSTELISWIESAKIGSRMFNNNIILNLIFKFI